MQPCARCTLPRFVLAVAPSELEVAMVAALPLLPLQLLAVPLVAALCNAPVQVLLAMRPPKCFEFEIFPTPVNLPVTQKKGKGNNKGECKRKGEMQGQRQKAKNREVQKQI